ncbi:hypothetical protein HYH03_008435 [Edaphochlamys debaryana]|uniref:Uncharacterized protein n=1 Tax=Edaphochlamys debaryana TaxID=47281 RepID=A0A836BZE7_9CHLO|nr:hypothetical protein HYH03_008435 [Edaphochlamys debaryana]|eukprot:KAG2493299.1 hypothetical protein HYH03_008435 [Edaphochlamys debaryana]
MMRKAQSTRAVCAKDFVLRALVPGAAAVLVSDLEQLAAGVMSPATYQKAVEKADDVLTIMVGAKEAYPIYTELQRVLAEEMAGLVEIHWKLADKLYLLKEAKAPEYYVLKAQARQVWVPIKEDAFPLALSASAVNLSAANGLPEVLKSLAKEALRTLDVLRDDEPNVVAVAAGLGKVRKIIRHIQKAMKVPKGMAMAGTLEAITAMMDEAPALKKAGKVMTKTTTIVEALAARPTA